MITTAYYQFTENTDEGSSVTMSEAEQTQFRMMPLMPRPKVAAQVLLVLWKYLVMFLQG